MQGPCHGKWLILLGLNRRIAQGFAQGFVRNAGYVKHSCFTVGADPSVRPLRDFDLNIFVGPAHGPAPTRIYTGLLVKCLFCIF